MQGTKNLGTVVGPSVYPAVKFSTGVLLSELTSKNDGLVQVDFTKGSSTVGGVIIQGSINGTNYITLGSQVATAAASKTTLISRRFFKYMRFGISFVGSSNDTDSVTVTIQE
jgi:hypothetical protein